MIQMWKTKFFRLHFINFLKVKVQYSEHHFNYFCTKQDWKVHLKTWNQ